MWIITATELQKKQMISAGRHGLIYTWQEFIHLCVTKTLPKDVYLLNSIEERFIWQEAIRQCSQSEQKSLLPFVKTFQPTFQLICQFDIPLSKLTAHHSPAAHVFSSLVMHFKKICAQKKLVVLLSAFQDFVLTRCYNHLPSKLIFYGFFLQTPLQKKALSEFKHSGIEIKEMSSEEKRSPSEVQLVTTENLEEALLPTVKQIKLWHEQNSQYKIAVVVNDLRAWEGRWRNALCCEFKDLTSWSVFVSQALADVPLIKTAINLLRFKNQMEWRLADVEALLESPYWGNMPQQMILRAKFLFRLRQWLFTDYKPEAVLALAKDFSELEKLFFHLLPKKSKEKKILSLWFVDWKKLLIEISFSENEHLSTHYTSKWAIIQPMITAWDKLPSLLEKYFLWQQVFTEREALEIFEQICQNHSVAPLEEGGREVNDKNNLHAKIKILSPLDALTQHFDYMIWWGVTAETKVLPTRSTPFIPMQVQKEYGVWGSDVAFNRQCTEACFDTFQRHTKELYLLHPTILADKVQQLSSFCEKLTAVKYVNLFGAREENFYDAIMQERDSSSTHDQASPLFAWNKTTILGSTSALKSQVLCPMQAFAKYRLRVKPLPLNQFGLTPIEKGLVVHRALQLVWQNIQTQENLIRLPNEALRELLKRSIYLGFQLIPWERKKQLPKALFVLEQNYLEELLSKWMSAEKTRPPFQIYALEKDAQILFGDYKWRVRVDRIDQLADGKLLLIDYKTGIASAKSCLPAQLTEPQLPFYVVTESHKIDGIAFAEVSAKTIRFTGFAKEALTLGGFGALAPIENWEDLQNQWQKKLLELTHDFVHSQAKLNPRDGENTCKLCGLQAFCRIKEVSN